MMSYASRARLTMLVLPTPSAASNAKHMFSSPSSMLLASTVHILTLWSCIIIAYVRLHRDSDITTCSLHRGNE